MSHTDTLPIKHSPGLPAAGRCREPRTIPNHQYAHLKGLSREQLAAVVEVAPRSLVLAGAGSGKTRVLTARAVHLLTQQGLAPQELIAFSFTRRACGEIQTRITTTFKQLHRPPPSSFVHTFHGFAFQLVGNHHQQLGFPRRPVIIAADGTPSPLALFRQFLKNEWHQPLPETAALVYHRLRPKPGDLADPTLQPIEEAFRAWKRREAWLELSDLIPCAICLLKGPVGEALRLRLKAVLIDEYQDIDAAQQHLFELLLGPQTGFTLFGDDDQAIYRWRGANPALIRAYHHQQDVHTHLLTVNFRCPGPILEVANAVIAQDPHRIPKTAQPHLHTGPVPTCIASSSQAKTVAALIHRLHAQGRPLAQIAGLVREHTDARAVERALIARGLPAVDSRDSGPNILTFHGSKGLEFPVVIIPFLNVGRFPSTDHLTHQHLDLRNRAAAIRKARFSLLLHRLRARFRWRLLRHLAHRRKRPRASAGRRETMRHRRKHRIQLEREIAYGPVVEDALKAWPEERRERLAEERRLCYVAMTRASEELWLLCQHRATRSPFLSGLGRKLITWETWEDG